jgi:Clp amino terminal domain, pathogenicity island component
MDLEQLIASVEESGGDDPLERVEAAAALKDQIDHLADDLLDHFVKAARAAGASWTQIGEALGVTRQAAQQRHGGLVERLIQGLKAGTFKRFTARAKTAVIAAQTAARDRGHTYVDTEHILLGLFAQDDGNVATEALSRLGLDRATVERLVDERSPAAGSRVSGHLPFSRLSKKALELSLREALRLGHNYIGCEHILLGLARVGRDGVAGEILSERGVTYDRLDAAIRDVLRDSA